MTIEPTMQNRTTAPVLVLDVGQVCIALTPERCAEILGVDRLEDVLLAYPGVSAIIERLETGRIEAPEFFESISSLLRMSRESVKLAWLANLGDELPGISAVVDEALSAGLKVVLMSDTSQLHADAFLDNLSFRDRLAGAIMSHEIGARKPADAMYEALENQFCDGGVPLLFADDKQGNVAAAEARGWQGFTMVRHDVAGLHEALRRRLAEFSG